MLTPKQEKYVTYLAKGMTQRKAYKKAYGCVNWKNKSIDNKASKMFQKAEIKARYKELIEKAAKRAEIKAEDILAEYKAIAFANGTDYAEIKNGLVKLKDTSELGEEKKKAISSIEETKFGISVKTHDKMKALEMLAKYVGLLENDKEEKNEIPTINLNIVDNTNLKEVMKEGND